MVGLHIPDVISSYPSQGVHCIHNLQSVVLVAHSCPTLCNPMDCSLPGFSVHVILQARVLEWVAMPSPGDLPDPGIEPGSTIVIMLYIRSSDPVHLGTEICTLLPTSPYFPISTQTLATSFLLSFSMSLTFFVDSMNK